MIYLLCSLVFAGLLSYLFFLYRCTLATGRKSTKELHRDNLAEGSTVSWKIPQKVASFECTFCIYLRNTATQAVWIGVNETLYPDSDLARLHHNQGGMKIAFVNKTVAFFYQGICKYQAPLPPDLFHHAWHKCRISLSNHSELLFSLGDEAITTLLCEFSTLPPTEEHDEQRYIHLHSTMGSYAVSGFCFSSQWHEGVLRGVHPLDEAHSMFLPTTHLHSIQGKPDDRKETDPQETEIVCASGSPPTETLVLGEPSVSLSVDPNATTCTARVVMTVEQFPLRVFWKSSDAEVNCFVFDGIEATLMWQQMKMDRFSFPLSREIALEFTYDSKKSTVRNETSEVTHSVPLFCWQFHVKDMKTWTVSCEQGKVHQIKTSFGL